MIIWNYIKTLEETSKSVIIWNYIEILGETDKFVCNVSEFSCACNYISDNNNKTT